MTLDRPRLQASRLVQLTLALLVSLASPALLIPAALAQQYSPPDRGMPGRREGGGTRGGCIQEQPSLTALMPDRNYGLVTRDHATLFWYVPSTSAMTVAEFVLLDESNREIYKTAMQLSGKPGIVGLTLPDNQIETDKDYHWYFSLVCDPQDRSGDLLTEGWIRQIEPDANLTSKLQAAAPEAQPTIYAEAGIWYAALSTLANQLRSQSNNPALMQQWRTLLGSVGLEDLADKPLL
jgi:hypothetical protein